MSFYVYILRCGDGSYYTGHTDNLIKRMAEHQAGVYQGYTLNKKPLKLVFSQQFNERIEALRAERQIKGWTRAKKEALINGDWDRLSQLAKKKFIISKK